MLPVLQITGDGLSNSAARVEAVSQQTGMATVTLLADRAPAPFRVPGPTPFRAPGPTPFRAPATVQLPVSRLAPLRNEVTY